jgi:multidrug efflux pump subunit AcrB
MRPVALAAATTSLGMLPLVSDAFFGGMAVTIMAGLSFATILTLIVIPVLYAIAFNVKTNNKKAVSELPKQCVMG